MKNSCATFRSALLSGFVIFLFPALIRFQEIAFADSEKVPGISGIVVDQDDKPVPDAIVRPKRISRSFESIHVKTDKNGRFELDRPMAWFDDLFAETLDDNLMGTVSLDGNAELKIVLIPSRTITGIVTDTEGKPVADAFVLGISSFSETARTQTDDEGRFSFSFPDDTVLDIVVALKDGLGMDYIWTMESPTTTEYRLFGRDGDPSQRKKSDGPFELKLDGARPVRLKLVDENGKPIPGIEVYPWYFTKNSRPNDLNIGTDLCERISGPDGVVVFDYFPAWQTEGLTFWSDENREEFKKTMRRRFLRNRTHIKPESFDSEKTIVMRRAVTVRGTVRFPDGRPAVGWQFRAQGHPDQFEQCVTDRQGRYIVPAVPGTILNLSVEQPKGPQGDMIEKDWACRSRRNVDLGEESLVIEDFVLEKGTRISGTATSGDARNPVEQGTIHITPLTPEEAEAEPDGHIQCWWWAPVRDGRYEFYAAPGDYRLRCQYGKGDKKQVRLESGKPLTVDFHVEEVRRDKKTVRTLRGKIQTADDPPKPVAGAKIKCASFDFDFHELYRRGFQSDQNGEFEIPVGEVSLYVEVWTADGKQAVMAGISPEEKKPVLVPKSPATITGKLLHWDTQEPVVGRRIKCCIRIPGEGANSRYSTTGFSRFVLTDEHGGYRFSDMPVGLDYIVSFMQMPRGEPETERNDYGSSEGLGTVSAEPGEVVNLETHRYRQRINVSDEYDWVFRQSYSRFGENSGFEDRFRVLLERCGRDGKNLLVVFATTETVEGDIISETYGPLPRKLMDLMFDRRSDVFDVADRFYVMGVPTDARRRYEEPKREEAAMFAKRREIDDTALDEMTLCFFDAGGTLLGAETIDEISEYRGDSNNKPTVEFQKDAVIELLKKYVPNHSSNIP